MIDVENSSPQPAWSASKAPSGRALRLRFVVALIAAVLGALLMTGLRPSDGARAALTASAVASSGPGAGTVAAGATGTMPIAVLGSFDAAPGAIPTVSVRIGNGPPLRVVLDTGSSGLWIRAADLPDGIPTLDTQRGLAPGVTQEASAWGDGNVTHDTFAAATVTIGGMTTVRPIPIAVVESISCQAVIACPSWAGGGDGPVGILGISPLGNGISPSPLLSLPAPYDSSWQISLHGRGGALQLGGALPVQPIAAFGIRAPGAVTPQPATSTAPESPFSSAAPTACWQFGQHATPACLPTIFDTGSAATGAFPADGFGSSTNHALRAGAHVSVRETPVAQPFWSFTSGTVISRNLVETPNGPAAYVVAGIPVFYAFTVSFNAFTSELMLSPASAAH